MARTSEEIYQESVAQKEATPELDGPDSPSGTAMWQLVLRCVAQVIQYFEVKLDLFKAELQKIVDDNQFGTFAWWEKKVGDFQYGDQLVFINNKWVYATVDTSKQIVKYTSITDDRGIVNVKAAKQTDNRPVNLDGDEAAALLSYMRKIRPPGIRMVVASLPADQLNLQLKVYYNAQVSLDVLQPLVEAQIVGYINNLDFNGVLFINKMIDAIQSIDAVINEQVEVVSTEVKQGASAYAQFGLKYQAVSGYFEIDSDFPLSSTIQYVGV